MSSLKNSPGDERGTDKRVPSRLTHHCSPSAPSKPLPLTCWLMPTSAAVATLHPPPFRGTPRSIFSGSTSQAARYSEQRFLLQTRPRHRLTRRAHAAPCRRYGRPLGVVRRSVLSKSHMRSPGRARSGGLNINANLFFLSLSLAFCHVL